MRVLGSDYAKAEEIQQGKEGSGAPGKSRTCDLLVRSQTLYPAELRAPRNANAVQIDYDTRAESSTISARLNFASAIFHFVRDVAVVANAIQIPVTISAPASPLFRTRYPVLSAS